MGLTSCVSGTERSVAETDKLFDLWEKSSATVCHTNVTDRSWSGVSSLKPPKAITAGVLKIPIADACQRGTYGLAHVQNDLAG